MSMAVPQSTSNPASAPDASPSLPDDPIILKRMIRELLETLKSTRRQNDQLHHRLDQLLRRLYGPRAEKFDSSQPWLFPELQQAPPTPAAPAPAEDDSATASPQKKNGHGRRKLPDSLPRVRQTHTLTDAECNCPDCGT